jgi:hypothetical protein
MGEIMAKCLCSTEFPPSTFGSLRASFSVLPLHVLTIKFQYPAYSFSLKMEAADSSKMLIMIYHGVTPQKTVIFMEL